MAVCVWRDGTAQYLRERLQRLAGSLHITTTHQLGKEDSRSLLPQFPHWPNEDNNATYYKGLFSIISDMINVDITFPGA